MAKKTVEQQREAIEGRIEDIENRYRDEVEELITQASFAVALRNELDKAKAELGEFDEKNGLKPKAGSKNEEELEDE